MRRRARASDQSRHRDRADDRGVEVHRRRPDVHGDPRRAGRRRLSAHLDQPDQSRHHRDDVGPGRGHHAERRRVVEQLVQPADRGVLSRHAPTTRFRIASAAASRRAARSAFRAAATTGRSRSANGNRSASRSTATSRPIRSIPTSSTAARCRAAIGARGRCSRSARASAGPPTIASSAPCRCCSRRSIRASCTSRRTCCGRRSTAGRSGIRSART